MPALPHPLASLIPSSNVLSVPTVRGLLGTATLESLYSDRSSFVGAFCNKEGQPEWARRIARYNRDEFHRDNPSSQRRFSEVASTLADDGAGKAWPNFRYALEQWAAGGKIGPQPYTVQQDYGSCVDASTTELLTSLMGWRVAQGTFREKFHRPAAWYFYANRGYCGDGWDCFALARVALQVGIAFRQPYTIGSNSVDFTDDDKNEQIVARTWCRSGIPAWMEDDSNASHPFEDGAITEFDGDVPAIRAIFAAGGALNTGGTNTSGGSKPFTIGRVGGHEQSIVGCDDSEEFRKFCRDVIGVTARDNDFPVIFNQTWGAGFSGECADKYWPPWWGPKPQGAWVWWASDVLRYFEGDIVAFLPRFKGVADPNPVPPPVPPLPPGPQPEPLPAMIDLTITQRIEPGDYLLVPKTHV